MEVLQSGETIMRLAPGLAGSVTLDGSCSTRITAFYL